MAGDEVGRERRARVDVHDVKPWVEIVVVLAAAIFAVARIDGTTEMLGREIANLSNVVREFKADVKEMLGDHETRLDATEKIVGRGVPPPEVEIQLDRIHRDLEEIKRKVK